MTDSTEAAVPGEPSTGGAARGLSRRVSRPAKYVTLLALVVGSGLTLLASTQTWFTVHLSSAADNAAAITVAGSAAAPALTALSLAGLALTAALAIAGPVFRIVLALLGILLGVSVLISAGSALGDPLRSASAAITTATGVAGESSLRRMVDSIDAGVWPAVAIVGGAVLVLASAAVIVTTRLWPGPSKRYQTRFEEPDAAAAEVGAGADAASATDAAEVDSDDAEARAVAEADQQGDGETPGTALERDQAIDSWDELSRGEDPTR